MKAFALILLSSVASASSDCGNGNACLEEQTCVPSHASRNSTGVVTGTMFGKYGHAPVLSTRIL